MHDPIEFWFDFSSPYAYFASIEITDRLERFGRPLDWKPFLLGVAYQRTGMSPLSSMPLRGDYARHDWGRIAAMLGVPFVLREDHPFRSQALARAYYWFADRDRELAVDFARAAFDEYFGQGGNLADASSVMALAARLTEDVAALAEWLASDEAKRVLRDRTSEAMAKGVFGSPFILVDGEPFWGWDRLPMVEAWLAGNRPNASRKGHRAGADTSATLHRSSNSRSGQRAT
jgi:2-hydroxychromene-2-carboxylate isomerase